MKPSRVLLILLKLVLCNIKENESCLGFCQLILYMNHCDIITNIERLFIKQEFINQIDTPRRRMGSSYYWTPYDWEPRIAYLKRKIKQLEALNATK